MGRARAASRSQIQEQLVQPTRRTRRGLVIDSFSSNPATGVWYYRLDVSVYEQDLLSTFINGNESDDSSTESDKSDEATDTKQYSILRRYNDFLQLYEQIRKVVIATEGDSKNLPPFPVKEYLSRAWAGLLWRVSSKNVLGERRARFETLLQWIENHPTARNCPAFVEFLGEPPQTQNGYVSLKEYTSPDWLSSLQQVTQGVEGRKRRYSAGSSAIRSLMERLTSDASGILPHPRRQRLVTVIETPTTRVLGKRRTRSAQWKRRTELPCKKMALTAALAGCSSAMQKLCDADQVPSPPLSCGKRKVAQLEGNIRKKQCVS